MNGLTSAFVAQAPAKMPPIEWPISPWLIVTPFLAFAAICAVLLLVGWWFRWPWLIAIVGLLISDDAVERPRRRRRFHS